MIAFNYFSWKWRRKIMYSFASPQSRCQEYWSPQRAVREVSVPVLSPWLTDSYLPSIHICVQSFPTILLFSCYQQQLDNIHWVLYKNPVRKEHSGHDRFRNGIILPHWTTTIIVGGSDLLQVAEASKYLSFLTCSSHLAVCFGDLSMSVHVDL